MSVMERRQYCGHLHSAEDMKILQQFWKVWRFYLWQIFDSWWQKVCSGAIWGVNMIDYKLSEKLMNEKNLGDNWRVLQHYFFLPTLLTQGLGWWFQQPEREGPPKCEGEYHSMLWTPSDLLLAPLGQAHQRHSGNSKGGHRQQHCPRRTEDLHGDPKGARSSSHLGWAEQIKATWKSIILFFLLS